MITKIQKWGNSQGLRLPRGILRQAHIAVGDNVDISLDNGGIVIRPSAVCRGKYRIKELLGDGLDSALPLQELDWGKPVGKELW